MIGAMHDLTIGVFGNIDITSTMFVDQRVAYKRLLPRGAAPKKYKLVLTECKDSAKELAVEQCNLGDVNTLSTERFWTWDNADGLDNNGDAYLGLYKCTDFNKELWFELGKCMWRKHCSIFQDHLRYICNDIVKPSRVGVIRYFERVQDMNYLEKNLPTTSTKDESFGAASLDVCN